MAHDVGIPLGTSPWSQNQGVWELESPPPGVHPFFPWKTVGTPPLPHDSDSSDVASADEASGAGRGAGGRADVCLPDGEVPPEGSQGAA